MAKVYQKEGIKGDFFVQYQTLHPDTMQGENYLESLRLLYKTRDGSDVYLGVPIEAPLPDLYGFVAGAEKAPLGDEKGLRSFISKNARKEPILVRVYSNFIQCRLATEGTHVFTRIVEVRAFTNRSGEARLALRAINQKGESAIWTCRAPELDPTIADEGGEDGINLNDSSRFFQYLIQFGLSWPDFIAVLQDAPTLWRRHPDDENGLFDPEDPWSDFIKFISFRPVQMVIEDDPDWGLGPRWTTGPFPGVEMMPVIALDEFAQARDLFAEAASNFAACIAAAENAVPVLGGQALNERGVQLAKAILVPIVQERPQLTLAKREDGTPGINVQVTQAHWSVRGLLAFAAMFEQALAANARGEIDISTPFSMIRLNGEPSEEFVDWALNKVPELSQVEPIKEKGETL